MGEDCSENYRNRRRMIALPFGWRLSADSKDCDSYCPKCGEIFKGKHPLSYTSNDYRREANHKCWGKSK